MTIKLDKLATIHRNRARREFDACVRGTVTQMQEELNAHVAKAEHRARVQKELREYREKKRRETRKTARRVWVLFYLLVAWVWLLIDRGVL